MPGLLEEQSDRKDEDTRKSPFPHAGATTSNAPLPKGVVLDKDGKPCKTCTSSAAWMSMMKSSTKPSTSSSSPASQSIPSTTTAPSPPDCPPDVEELGRASWTLLHTMTANYPDSPPPAHQAKTKSFLHLFSQLYPCWVCAEDFQSWMKEPENDPEASGALKTQEGFGRWMCAAHNAVNGKLGKREFDCNLWRERWKDGWRDGRCD
ncbi:Flavin-linked sulfhydryl oxidase of the mitochondrial IMS [Knufia obscura]|uniref:Sulfhydryl oxidase n=2 Tax=Knufia TaxID=430999 RepID=A0AAN8I7E2_9EURO|nr:Flavin-linked sulfhydryl oxidase of the mitochondrial IMS [Knufia obscura]KAK5958097.1 Flavin-linked sulfhydryl oxidase of the mitochondrial IMS [Knufia fluminis]